MVSKKVKRAKNILWVVLFILAMFTTGLVIQSFSLIPNGETVWIPQYGKIACQQTRLECKPGICSDTNPEFKQINQDGESFYCGAPTFTDANFYEGCTFYLKASGWLDATTIKVCNKDGTNCQDASIQPDTIKFSGSTRKISIMPYQKLYINPNIATYSYHMIAPVYGIAIDGAIKPKYSDRCNLASLLSDHQIAVLKNSPDYAKVNMAGEISPQVYPVVFITGYSTSYKDSRILEKNGESWFVEDIGTRCKIEQDTNSRYIVTDNCVEDNSIECFPNVGNCDAYGKLQVDTTTGKTCVPNTLIGSNTQRVAISATDACKARCSSAGKPENFDCVKIPSCSDGKILNPNYECVESTKLSEKEKCEAGKGTYSETKDNSGNIVSSCNYGTPDYFYWYLVLAVLAIIVIMLIVKLTIERKRS